MSLSNEENFEKYSPSVPTTEFEWGIYYFADTDVLVDVEDSAGDVTSLVLNASTDGFTVQATNGDKREGATITTTESYTSGDNITISREVPYTQEYDLKSGQAVNATALNKALDRVVAQNQQQNESLDRHLVHPITDAAGLNYEAPTVVNRANKALGYDANGNVVALNLASSGTIAGNAAAGINVISNVISSRVDGSTIDFDAEGKHEVIGIPDGVVTDAKVSDVSTSKLTGDILKSQIEDVANMKVLGNVSGGATSPQEVDIIDDDTMATATDINVPTSESVKAYVDDFDAGSFLATSGYQILSSGLIMQWGTESLSGFASDTVTLPIAMPTDVLSVSATYGSTSNTLDVACGGFIVSATQISVTNGLAAGHNIYWIAIGH